MESAADGLSGAESANQVPLAAADAHPGRIGPLLQRRRRPRPDPVFGARFLPKQQVLPGIRVDEPPETGRIDAEKI